MQSRESDRYYEGMVDCFRKIFNEEGIWTFYKALPPRLAAVMPMIGIQFSVYELMKRVLLQTDKEQSSSGPSSISSGSSTTMKMYQTITENKQGLLKKEVTNYTHLFCCCSPLVVVFFSFFLLLFISIFQCYRYSFIFYFV